MRIGCLEIVRGKGSKDGEQTACVLWKGHFIGLLFGDGSDTQIMTLDTDNVKMITNKHGKGIYPKKNLVKSGD